jgi:branched-chain amino acid transport system substrate-binding protein
MRQIRSIGFIVLAMVLLVTLVVGTRSRAMAAEEIRIGLSTALSGDAAAWGIAHFRAVELIAEKYNADGGIYIADAGKKLPIKIIAYDDKYTPSEAAIAAKRLIHQDKVHAIANMGEEMATTIAPLAKEAGIIQWGTSWELTDPNPDFPLSFSCLTRNLEMFPAGLAWFHAKVGKQAGVKRMGSIAVNNAGGLVEHDIAEAAGAAVGMELVFKDVFDWGTVDFSPILLKAISKDVQVFAFSSAPPDSVGNIVKQSTDLGYKGYFMGFMSDIAVISDIAGAENTEERVFSAGELGSPIPEAAKGYADAYLSKYGPPLSAMTLIPWLQSWEPLFAAIEKTQSLDAEVIANELRSGTLPTIGGDVTFGGKEFYGIDNQMLASLPVSVARGGKPVMMDWAQPVAYPEKLKKK